MGKRGRREKFPAFPGKREPPFSARKRRLSIGPGRDLLIVPSAAAQNDGRLDGFRGCGGVQIGQRDVMLLLAAQHLPHEEGDLFACNVLLVPLGYGDQEGGGLRLGVIAYAFTGAAAVKGRVDAIAVKQICRRVDPIPLQIPHRHKDGCLVALNKG